MNETVQGIYDILKSEANSTSYVLTAFKIYEYTLKAAIKKIYKHLYELADRSPGGVLNISTSNIEFLAGDYGISAEEIRRIIS